MDHQHFTTSFLVDQSPEEAFHAINQVHKWWTENIEGSFEKTDDEFAVRFADVHYSKQKLVEVIPVRKVVWLVTDSALSFLKEKNEWTGTKISFEISQKDDQTEVRFTHWGLRPEIECFHACSNAWSDYINHSLRNLIITGKGQPSAREL
jgi:hypothetical protein